MPADFANITTRFLRDDERLILSEEKELPLVYEANTKTDLPFLQTFLKKNEKKILKNLATYGAILLRGFDIQNDHDFEETILSLPSMRGISEAFMSENGRETVEGQRYVLPTNSVYKTGGTLYLGGFHSENYYSTDVPTYLAFCCLKPSTLGGETGIINTAKIYQTLSKTVQNKLEKKAYFAAEWLVSAVAKRYDIAPETIETLCKEFNVPIIGEGDNKLILMYKPSVFQHPITQEKALNINLFELPTLNTALRQRFMQDYAGKAWFWHRFFWKIPPRLFKIIEQTAVMCIAFFNSPKKAYRIAINTLSQKLADKKNHTVTKTQKVGSCFTPKDTQKLATAMRDNYSSCIWKKGDILLLDNRKVMHAGMPGMGDRLIRAFIGNPLELSYLTKESGCIVCKERTTDTLGAYMKAGTTVDTQSTERLHLNA